MIEWRVKRDRDHDPRGWDIYEYPDRSATRCTRLVASGLTEDDARRVARLSNLETIVDKLPKDANGVPVTPGVERWRYCEQCCSVHAFHVLHVFRCNYLTRAFSQACGSESHPVADCCTTQEAAEEHCPGCGAEAEEGPREDGYTRWACGSKRGPWGFGRSWACWERREAAEAAKGKSC